MKIDKDIPEDMMELGVKIKQLPLIIKNHMGEFPQSFPVRYNPTKRVDDWAVDMEITWKKWVFDWLLMNTSLSDIFNGSEFKEKDYYGDDYS